MAKKVIRRKSSARRISPRPLSFWHFIRKNLLIISGLLLLPVTVRAVISSYNYANQSSAASLKRTLKTQDIGIISGEDCAQYGFGTQLVVNCNNPPMCKICSYTSQNYDLFAACQTQCIESYNRCLQTCDNVGGPSYVTNSCKHDCNINKERCLVQEDCNKYLTQLVWSQEIRDCPNQAQALTQCGIVSSDPVAEGRKKECEFGSQRLAPNGCIKKDGKYQCYLCEANDEWEGKWSTDIRDCSDQGQAKLTCESQQQPVPPVGGQGGGQENPPAANPPQENPPPQGGQQPDNRPAEKPPENQGSCSWYCSPLPGGDGCPAGAAKQLPNISCDTNGNGNGNLCADCLNPQSAGGFDIRKAIRDFFGGIFGWQKAGY